MKQKLDKISKELAGASKKHAKQSEPLAGSATLHARQSTDLRELVKNAARKALAR